MLDRPRDAARARADRALRGQQRPAAGVDDRAATPRGRPRRAARARRVPRAPPRVPRLAGRVRRARGLARPRSSSSRAGARSRRRPRSRGAGGTASPTSCSSSSNERDARPGWRRAVKGAVVPRIVRGAARGPRRREARARVDARARRRPGADLALRRHDRRRRLRRGGRPARPRRDELRAEAGLGAEDVAVLSVARLAPEKGLDTLSRAVALAGRPAARPASSPAAGPSASGSRRLRAELGVRLVVLPEHPLGADRRAVRDRGRLRASLAARALGRRRQRGGRLRVAARPLGPGRAPRSTCSRTGRNGVLVPADDPHAAGRGAPRARRRPGAPPRGRGGLARADARLGLRSEHREPRPGRAARRRASGAASASS